MDIFDDDMRLKLDFHNYLLYKGYFQDVKTGSIFNSPSGRNVSRNDQDIGPNQPAVFVDNAQIIDHTFFINYDMTMVDYII